MTEKEWKPPFGRLGCAQGLECPRDGCDGTVMVRSKYHYYDGDEVESYCAECHSDLYVQVSVHIKFSDVELVPEDEE